jgi:hypothetical protein
MEGSVSTGTWNALMLAVALLSTGGCGYYYVQGVLDEDRSLSRAAAFAFFVFGVVSAVFIRRLL